MHGLLVKGSEGQARTNPLAKIAADAAADMICWGIWLFACGQEPDSRGP
jgi:hypothetical protein